IGIMIVGLGAVAGTHVAGGADSYGYLSQAELWLSGHLRVDQRWLALPEPPFDEWALTPLGYRPGTQPGIIVPIYSPGLPLLMAAGKLIASGGAHAVVPIMGGLMVMLTFVLGRLLFSDAVGLGAVLLLAASPAFLIHLMMPMSDVPAAAV